MVEGWGWGGKVDGDSWRALDVYQGRSMSKGSGMNTACNGVDNPRLVNHYGIEETSSNV
jgi:hypothetical protein